VFNELFFLSLTVVFFNFTDYTDITLAKWRAGWAAIIIILLNLAMNIAIILVDIGSKIVNKIRQRFFNKRI
jgi:hypothetical protein